MLHLKSVKVGYAILLVPLPKTKNLAGKAIQRRVALGFGQTSGYKITWSIFNNYILDKKNSQKLAKPFDSTANWKNNVKLTIFSIDETKHAILIFFLKKKPFMLNWRSPQPLLSPPTARRLHFLFLFITI